MKAQYSRKTIVGVIGVLVATGGYGGYTVVKGYQKYGGDFETRRHIVARVIDGDTVELEDKIKVRLLGVNAPERGECYFEESKKTLDSLLEGSTVLVEKDMTGKDRFGRLLRYVKIPADDPEGDDLFVNNELVRRGAATALSIAPDTKYRDLFATAQREAKKAKTGLWGVCDYATKDQDLREADSLPPSPSCTIKGNISEKGYGKNYFLEGCPNYLSMKIDPRKGEAWFCSEREAQKAGFTRSASCDNPF
ncbi:MAG: thermonuclease family protein [Patescibacteria group bacterium]